MCVHPGVLVSIPGECWPTYSWVGGISFLSFSFFFLNRWESLVRLCFLSRQRQGNAVEVEEIPSRLLEGSEGLDLNASRKRQGLCGHSRGRAPCWIPRVGRGCLAQRQTRSLRRRCTLDTFQGQRRTSSEKVLLRALGNV